MSGADADRLYLTAALPELQAYLLSQELYWPLGTIRDGLTRLTIGGLLLSSRRARARAGDPQVRAELDRLAGELELARRRWPVAWEKKAAREVGARVKLWAGYLADYAQSRETYAADYAGQVRGRTMIALLIEDLTVPPAETGALAGLDRTLRASFLPGDFLWEADLRPAFPPEDFWFLYGRLKD